MIDGDQKLMLEQLCALPIKPRMVFAHMRSALAYAQTSYAQRLKVGCVIVDPKTDQPVSIGWNGTAPGEPNVCERTGENGELISEGVIHAEQNALSRLPLHVEDTCGLVLFVTHSPCPVCTKLIIDSGIETVIYQQPYRIVDGIREMLQAGIRVYRMVDLYAISQHTLNADGIGMTSVPFLINPDV